MGDALEALQWEEWSARKLTIKRPVPLEMTYEQIVSFINEYDVGVTWTPATTHTLRICTLTSDWFPTTKGTSLDEAVKLAAAKVKEENE